MTIETMSAAGKEFVAAMRKICPEDLGKFKGDIYIAGIVINKFLDGKTRTEGCFFLAALIYSIIRSKENNDENTIFVLKQLMQHTIKIAEGGEKSDLHTNT